jgi:phosphoribosylformimino-5-aminoimidazole carboxamide ribotide isomerase
VGGIIYTDISRDGMLSGPNIEATARMVRALKVPVIASGGVSALKDIEALLRIEGLGGVIIGKALYDGRLSLEEALELAGNAG